MLPKNVAGKVQHCMPRYKEYLVNAFLPSCDGKCQTSKLCNSACEVFQQECVPPALAQMLPMVGRQGPMRSMLYSLTGPEGSPTLLVVDAALEVLTTCADGAYMSMESKDSQCSVATMNRCDWQNYVAPSTVTTPAPFTPGTGAMNVTTLPGVTPPVMPPLPPVPVDPATPDKLCSWSGQKATCEPENACSYQPKKDDTSLTMSCRAKTVVTAPDNVTYGGGGCELITGMKVYGADSNHYMGKNQLEGISLQEVKEGLMKMFQTLPLATSFLPPEEKFKFEKCLPQYKKHFVTAFLPSCNGRCEAEKYCASSCTKFHEQCISQNFQTLLQMIGKQGKLRGLLYSVAGHEGSPTLAVVDAALKTLSEDGCREDASENAYNMISENATCASSTVSKCNIPKQNITKPVARPPISATRLNVLQLIREVQTVQKKLDGMTHDMKTVMYNKCKGGCKPVGVVVDDESGIAIAPPRYGSHVDKQRREKNRRMQ